MGLSQQIRFEYNEKKLVKLLKDIGYEKNGIFFSKKNSTFEIELVIEQYGLYIHRSGEYFKEFGLLIERLGDITEAIVIEDE